MAIPAATVEQYVTMQRLQVLAVAAARRSWKRVEPAYLSESWQGALESLTPVVSAVQVRAAAAGAAYGAATLAEQGVYVAPDSFVNAAGFGGFAADGRSLTGSLYSPITDVKSWIGGGYSVDQALSMGRSALDSLMRTTVADAGRTAAGVDIAVRPNTGYVRMLNPPSCPRCTVLAGKFFRWNAGFKRHPACDCVHSISTAGGTQAARDEGLIDDPYKYFSSLSEAEQNKAFGKAGAQAIRDGGDVYQVVNSQRGLRYAGISSDGSARGQKVGAFTSEGTTKRGNFRTNTTAGGTTSGRRLTPEAIYRLNGENRAAALLDLEKYGYILPGGQNPLGSIVGQREGFGALGRGGTRKAASQAVLDARTTGVRDGSRYTMTSAERRLNDAKQRWSMVQQGRNPYSSPGFGNTPDPLGLRLNTVGARVEPLTPKIAAQVEQDYRRWVASSGQIY